MTKPAFGDGAEVQGPSGYDVLFLTTFPTSVLASLSPCLRKEGERGCANRKTFIGLCPCSQSTGERAWHDHGPGATRGWVCTVGVTKHLHSVGLHDNHSCR